MALAGDFLAAGFLAAGLRRARGQGWVEEARRSSSLPAWAAQAPVATRVASRGRPGLCEVRSPGLSCARVVKLQFASRERQTVSPRV